ncbi:hypothetical protein GOP47_0007676 [Adiantum capillus-veneris]|uniref:THO complex subunit 1 n=1 Tax=Adiantum capillus-veneris TaxID=13818 RepID=A0A9D4V210_ADICA|nr:hypothetical protein GOP47_0007676 [Adiantum capillus-veneris]
MAEATAHPPQPLRIHLSQPPRERVPVVVSCHAERDRVMEVFRDAISCSAPPEAIALSTMQEAVRPQKQTILVQDENQLLENGLRTLMQELVGAAVEAGQPVMQYGTSLSEGEDATGLITKLLDIVLFLCERGHVEGGMVFQLLEDLTEVSTIKDCKEVFGYIEGKQETLGKAELFGRGKLVMLRTCNQLLRRLSKANDVVFCGRILMFLAHFFPLSERSAVNIKGIFNTYNETTYEKEPPGDGLSLDFNFYKTFWSLQEYFCNPMVLLQYGTKWQTFSSSLGVVLSTFEAQPLGGDNESLGHLDESDNTAFQIKYLTSSKLMSLELKDSSFRRHILVQCLIIFDYLKTPSKTDKEGLRELLREEVKVLEERVKKLLEVTPPKGKDFLANIEHILEREQNWVWWKRDGCSAFDRVIPEKKSTQEQSKKRKTRWRLGNKELSQLWRWAEQNSNSLTDQQRARMPPVPEYWKALADDMDTSAGIEGEYHHRNNRVYCWKGLRFSARQDLDGFSRFTDRGIEGVVPPELLPLDVRVKLHGKSNERSKQRAAKKEDDSKAGSSQAEDMHIGASNQAVLDDSSIPQDMDDATVDTEPNPSAAPTPDESQKQGSDADGPVERVLSGVGSPEIGHVIDAPSPSPLQDVVAQKAPLDSALLKPPRKRAHLES